MALSAQSKPEATVVVANVNGTTLLSRLVSDFFQGHDVVSASSDMRGRARIALASHDAAFRAAAALNGRFFDGARLTVWLRRPRLVYWLQQVEMGLVAPKQPPLTMTDASEEDPADGDGASVCGVVSPHAGPTARQRCTVDIARVLSWLEAHRNDLS